jgi:MoaA/NifB/PqqE/SkfB family radical SAM enzyme
MIRLFRERNKRRIREAAETAPYVVSGWRADLVRRRLHLYIITRAGRYFRNPVIAVKEIQRLRKLRSSVHGNRAITKFVCAGKRWFWNSDYCGFPSPQAGALIDTEFMRKSNGMRNNRPERPMLQTLIWGITNRCPMSCLHCYEWDNISKKDSLDLTELMKILHSFRECGIRHIQFSGGEPLVRFSDLLVLIREASVSMDCWLLTSGFNLNGEKASALYQAGLTGVNISLDHWDPDEHNRFRNHTESFRMVSAAIDHCRDAGLMVSLSLCATPDFVSEENLMKYARYAFGKGVHFVRILEPRAAGRFSGKSVHLSPLQVQQLSEFTIRVNSRPEFSNYPVFAFFGYHQRQMGCFGAGNRYLYIDPNGDVHACPFCRGSNGNLLNESFIAIVNRVRASGCQAFNTLAG